MVQNVKKCLLEFINRSLWDTKVLFAFRFLILFFIQFSGFDWNQIASEYIPVWGILLSQKGQHFSKFGFIGSDFQMAIKKHIHTQSGITLSN